jgi:hypothetical protein
MVIDSLVSSKGLESQEYADLHIFMRCFYIIGLLWLKFSKLMVGFIAMEANLIACGHGYAPATEKQPENFNSLRSICVRPIFDMISLKDALAGWNVAIHNWLKYYIMMRLMDRSKPRS